MKPRSSLTHALFLVFALLLTIALLAWSPWITPAFARQRAVESFASAWRGVADGCSIDCNGCRVIDSQKTIFGAFVTLEYACGLIPPDSPKVRTRSAGFVSFLGTVHGFPTP